MKDYAVRVESIMKKWHKVALILAVVIGIAVCVKSCVGKVEADIFIAYIGNNFVSQEKFNENVKELENVCHDLTDDGVVNVSLMEIVFNEDLNQEEARRKMTNAIGLGTARVYVLTAPYVILNSAYDVFEDLSHFGDGFKNADGQTVAISLEGNEKAEKLGFPKNERLYLAVRKVSEMDSAMDKDIEKKHDCAMKIAEYILN